MCRGGVREIEKRGLEGSTFNSKECENCGLMTFSIIINKLKLLYVKNWCDRQILLFNLFALGILS